MGGKMHLEDTVVYLLHDLHSYRQHASGCILILRVFQERFVAPAKARHTGWKVDVAVYLYQIGCVACSNPL